MNASEREHAAVSDGPVAPEAVRARPALRAGLRMVGAVFACVVLGAATNLPASSSEPQAAASSFAALMAAFERMDAFEARFEETKTLALLIDPLRTSGRLYYAKPSMLLRRVELPRPTDILVTNDIVRIRDGSGEQVIDLAAHAEARPLVEAMLWLFAGDAAALESEFSVDYQVRAQAEDSEGVAESNGFAWELRLVPIRSPVDRLVKEIRIRGVGQAAESIELIEPGGDRTLTRILDSNSDRRFDSEERRELFGLPEP